MAIGSVMQTGLAGMQTSQREMVKAADQVAKAGLEPQGMTPPAPGDLAPAERPVKTSSQDLVEPLIEMRRQEQIFTASAKMVSIADKTLGSLIDVTS
jgi:hypothetical protein